MSTGLSAVLNPKVPRTGAEPASLIPISSVVGSCEKEYPSSTFNSKVLEVVQFAGSKSAGD